MDFIQTITSRDNTRLKLVRRIRDGKAPGIVFVEGVRLAEEALRSNLVIENAFLSETAATTERGREIAGQLEGLQIDTFLLSDQLAASIADTANSQGVILTARRPPEDQRSFEVRTSAFNDKLPLFIFLNEISDPANLGAVLRTAEAAGATGVITSTASADVFSPKAIRASMGAAFRVAIWNKASARHVFQMADGRGLRKTAAVGSGAVNYDAIDWKTPRLLVIGSEANGLEPEIVEQMDDVIRIPMESNVESLNLAVAAGVILFEAARQHRSASNE